MYRIVAVCTGNICRSPAMEVLLARMLDSSVTVSSAGTHGLPSWPVHPPMARLLREKIGEADSQMVAFRSRRLTEAMVGEADLILTATASHRADVLALDPLALKRTMTLGEFARIAAALNNSAGVSHRFGERTADGDAAQPSEMTDAERLQVLVPAVLAARHQFTDAKPSGDDIVDPYGLDDGVYADSLRQVSTHIDRLAGALGR
ncbi:MAG: low molecular weight phosphatase family protein [Cellulomonadaceae bacterium]|jgi:protein-tyrosine phosphatase|nr:low molecular weight phosphatase family protein [Cellulomonadaceae bacterium]